jgi:hypothetical protein
MIFLVLVTMLVSALTVPLARSGEQEDAFKELERIFDRNVERALPSGAIFAGNIIRGDNWHVLGAPEISAVRALLEKGQRRGTEGLPPQVPPAVIKVVLWGSADGKVKPLKVFLVDSSVTVILPLDGKGGYVPVRDSKERDCLQKAISRILDGKDPAVAKSLSTGALPKGHESDSKAPKKRN